MRCCFGSCDWTRCVSSGPGQARFRRFSNLNREGARFGFGTSSAGLGGSRKICWGWLLRFGTFERFPGGAAAWISRARSSAAPSRFWSTTGA